MLNSKQFNDTLLEVNQAVHILEPEILNLINYTENQLSKKSFVESFLSSLREKMYDKGN